MARPCASCACITSGAEPANHARQTPGRRQIQLGAWGDRNQLEAFGGPAAELAVGVGDERGALADGPQAIHGQQYLVLASAPRAGGVDVQGEHYGSRFGVLGCG